MTKPIAVITGASRGIGAAIAQKLAQDGFHVFINYTSNEAKAAEVQAAIVSSGGTAELCRFDVSQSAQVDEQFQLIQKNAGPISVLVNNAGITCDGLILRMKDEDLRKTLAIDLEGAIYCTRAALKQMVRAKQGSIIQISSVVGEMGNAGQSAYAAAKAGLIGFSKSIAREIGSRHIRVNVVTPGFITTDMTEVLTAEQKEAILRTIPLGLFGNPEDVANLVAFLASPASGYITGQVIGINGGQYM
ncbi:MAG TPA: 3-oxoacyl-[acyl-carrier-protein] reductase [Bdellovibrionales bacterium]|nr:MAG: 3-oxoacyl-[acyl-carrier-protein] reductase [Bdellovibrionales bacterium GWB1_52_6]OFZ06039.1 MAG: 3-oxoacyl-[acyl-carrier-protein] reductase [Bdellovibrionales bacterium GWA1_52_35]HAR44254.1 3-oxoacyl-[acyl-carrier-protein] reductase [Bdellovibrionales bacterium]HCM39336.1 3-oxoacyl-[acyl-carrier-protein] reductase [Bdellovibrionales bacterium]